jgi:hypothetical protein
MWLRHPKSESDTGGEIAKTPLKFASIRVHSPFLLHGSGSSMARVIIAYRCPMADGFQPTANLHFFGSTPPIAG